MKVGEWEVNVGIDVMPQKVATAFAAVNANLVGAEYTPISYLGSQVVNGINHAVLAEQLLTDGKDTKNVVLMIFNEKGMGCTLANIERVVESGSGFGGTNVDIHVDIPKDAKDLFNEVFEDFIGVDYEPFALLATQMTKGTTYVFAAIATILTGEPIRKVTIVTINSLTKKVSFTDIMQSGLEISLGKPLGEWP